LLYDSTVVHSSSNGAGEGQFHPSKCVAIGPGTMQAAIFKRADLPLTDPPTDLGLESQPFK